MNENDGFALALLLVIVIGIGAMYMVMPTSTKYETTYYNVYYVNAPFGTLWVDTEGYFIFGCGSIQSSLQESYTVKYFIGNSLHSINLEADKTPVVADGTFRLEVKVYKGKNLANNKWYIIRIVYYRIHIPDFPPINQTVQWNIVGGN